MTRRSHRSSKTQVLRATASRCTPRFGNARALLDLRELGIRFSEFLWAFSGGAPVINAWRRLEDVPAATPVSEAMSKALKDRGFRFVGPTICYAFMQAVGMMNDHLTSCFRWEECKGLVEDVH